MKNNHFIKIFIILTSASFLSILHTNKLTTKNTIASNPSWKIYSKSNKNISSKTIVNKIILDKKNSSQNVTNESKKNDLTEENKEEIAISAFVATTIILSFLVVSALLIGSKFNNWRVSRFNDKCANDFLTFLDDRNYETFHNDSNHTTFDRNSTSEYVSHSREDNVINLEATNNNTKSDNEEAYTSHISSNDIFQRTNYKYDNRINVKSNNKRQIKNDVVNLDRQLNSSYIKTDFSSIINDVNDYDKLKSHYDNWIAITNENSHIVLERHVISIRELEFVFKYVEINSKGDIFVSSNINMRAIYEFKNTKPKLFMDFIGYIIYK